MGYWYRLGICFPSAILVDHLLNHNVVLVNVCRWISGLPPSHEHSFLVKGLWSYHFHSFNVWPVWEKTESEPMLCGWLIIHLEDRYGTCGCKNSETEPPTPTLPPPPGRGLSMRTCICVHAFMQWISVSAHVCMLAPPSPKKTCRNQLKYPFVGSLKKSHWFF